MTLIDRRSLMLAAAALPMAASALSAPKEKLMAFTLPPLPYAPAALEPVIDTQTMELHHNKHHQAYVDKLNEGVAADPALASLTLDQIVAKAGSLPPLVRNNAGGHWNHSLFWKLMAAPGHTGEPSGALRDQIAADFGSVNSMQEKFNAAGVGRFGSGWAWLIWANGKLAITSTPNQDNPHMDAAEHKGAVVLGNDVWEHAYYLKHQNKRADYLKNWWQVLNWSEASKRFDTAKTA